MNTKRFLQIDFLRAVSILGVIVIHVLSFNLSGPVQKFFWNYLQFVVAGFLMCSGAVLFNKSALTIISLSDVLVWYKKRLSRLLIPYYIYLTFHLVLIFIFPTYFKGVGFEINSSFWYKALFLTGGVNHNWLVLLFVQLTILFPLLAWSIRTKKMIHRLYAVIAILMATFFFVYKFPYELYRYVMWLPWSLALLVGFAIPFMSRKTIILASLLSFIAFMLLLYAVAIHNDPINLFDHKYPPDLYHLMYGISISLLVYLLGVVTEVNELLKKIILFISTHSYSIYFIHFIFLDFFINQNFFKQGVVFELIEVIGLTLFIIYLKTIIQNKIAKTSL